MMRRFRNDKSGGFSLVELIVVLAIIGILSGIAVGFTGAFAQNAMDRGARSLYTMLRAARVYAATYKVNTAVVYQLDQDPVGAQLEDSIKRISVRTIRAAAVMYELPASMGMYAGKYVPSPKFGGDFEPFPVGYSLLLDGVPDGPDKVVGEVTYGWSNDLTLGDPAYYTSQTDYSVGKLGMTPVTLYTDPISEDPVVRAAEYDPNAQVKCLAHVFKAGGALNAGGTTERYRVLFAPSPERPREERMWYSTPVDDANLALWLNSSPSAPEMGMVGIPIEIFRSTGRVVMGEL